MNSNKHRYALSSLIAGLFLCLCGCSGQGSSELPNGDTNNTPTPTPTPTPISNTPTPNTPIPPWTAPAISGACNPNRFVTANAMGGGDGSAAQPWTLAEAMQQAVAGHRVQVAPGIYIGAPTGARYVPTFAPANSGNATAPIVFCAQYPAAHNETRTDLWAEVRNLCANPGVENRNCSPVLGVANRDYIVLDGFAADQLYSPWRPDVGPVVMVGSSYSQFRHLRVVTRPQPFYDNNPAIRVDYSQYLAITDNRLICIYSASNPSEGQGTAGIMSYDSGFYEWAHNEIQGCRSGLFPKGVHYDAQRPTQWMAPGRIHHNRVTGTQWGVLVMGAPGAPEDQLPPDYFIDVYQNVIHDTYQGSSLNPIGATNTRRLRFVNNTIVAQHADLGAGISVSSMPAADNFEQSLWRNNISMGMAAPYGFYGSGTGARTGLERLDFDYNRFHEIRALVVSTDSVGFEPIVDSLSEWQGLGHDPHSTQGDPGFIDYAQRDLRLRSDSACRNAGTDYLNLRGNSVGAPIHQGAYITDDQSDVIGIRPAN